MLPFINHPSYRPDGLKSVTGARTVTFAGQGLPGDADSNGNQGADVVRLQQAGGFNIPWIVWALR
jgi:hypothetical protein